MATSTVTTVVTKIELVADLEIAEYDKAGNLKATYVESGWKKGPKRVDVLVSARNLDVILERKLTCVCSNRRMRRD